MALGLWYRTWRNSRAKGIPTPFPKTKLYRLFVAAIIICDIAIVLRSIYRVIELAQGWDGYLITTEPWFYGFDTAPMFICTAIWIVGHPGITLGQKLARSDLREKRNGEGASVNGFDQGSV